MVRTLIHFLLFIVLYTSTNAKELDNGTHKDVIKIKNPEIIEQTQDTLNKDEVNNKQNKIEQKEELKQQEASVSTTTLQTEQIQPIVDQNVDQNKTKIGNFFNSAKIIALNIKTGEKTELILKKGDGIEFANMEISLQTCWKQKEKVLFPESKALIEIFDKNEKETVFSGWLFSNHSNISQPSYKNYLFYISSCCEK
jgi:hypothetical protein